MNSYLVIKVKYEDALRRFSVVRHGNGSLDLDMNGMRAKIINLFKLSPDAELTITYTDEDNDVVTLVDDEDLLDAVKQCLNPLRINVHINSDRTGSSDTRSSGTSTPIISTQVYSNPLSQLNSGLAEILKSVPEPLLITLTKLSYDLASKATSSAPAFLPEPFNTLLKHSHYLVSRDASSGSVPSDLMECLMKLGISPQDPSTYQGGVTLNAQNNDSENSKDHNANGAPKASKDQAASSKLKSLIDNPTVNDSGNLTRGVATPVPPANVTLSKDSDGSGLSTGENPVPLNIAPNDRGKKLQQECDGSLTGNSLAPGPSIPTSLADPPAGLQVQPSHALKEASVPLVDGHENFAARGDKKKKNLSNIGGSLGLPDVSSMHNGCPSSAQKGPDSAIRCHNIRTVKRGKSHFNSMGRIFHRGVCCNGCGVYPITGPRYKSLVKEDYDLCSICYAEMGIEGHYTRMDHPVAHRPPRLLKELHDPFWHPRFRKALSHHTWHGGEMNIHPQRLDSCFVNDVNVIDGTSVAPKTSFTKIWRMLNNGTMTWPKGTQLVWIGGEQLTDRVSVEVEIPFDGCAAGKEIDIAVDCTAPELPGQYISYWRLALPSGHKFGQCVWVLIQVEGSLQDPWAQVDDSSKDPWAQADESSKDPWAQVFGSTKDPFAQVEGSSQDPFSVSLNPWNLSLPAGGSGTKEQVIDMNVMPVDDVSDPEFISNMATELVKPIVNEKADNNHKLSPNGESVTVTEGVSYPLIDLSTTPSDPSSLINAPELSENISESTTVEQNLLKELDEMGFKQIGLNKEILRMNEYNLERSVDDLCGFSEWDPLLEELQEMGFCDREKNTKLLIKNGGSIKRVVMDLIAGEKA